MKLKTSSEHCWKYVVFYLFNSILMLKTKNCIVSKKSHQPIQPKPHWFGLDFILKVNGTKPNRMFFYLAVQMTFSFKTEPNCTGNTPISTCLGPLILPLHRGSECLLVEFKWLGTTYILNLVECSHSLTCIWRTSSSITTLPVKNEHLKIHANNNIVSTT